MKRPQADAASRRAPPGAPAAPAPPPAASRIARIAVWVAVAAGILIPVDLLLHGRAMTGAATPLLDPAWTHLAHARTVAEHGRWSVHPGVPATSGTTAPLWVLLEAGLLRLGASPVAAALGLSLASHALFLLAFAGWARRRLGGPGWAAAAVATVALDPRLAMLAASGMETSLFLLFTALAFRDRLAGRGRRAGLALGAAVWVRPEGFLVAAALMLDALRPGGTVAESRARARPAVRGSLLGFAVFAAAYFGWNLATGGALLPRTFDAATAFHRAAGREAFGAALLAALLLVGRLPLLPLLALAAGREVVLAARRRGGAARAEVLLVAGLAAALAVVLPTTGPLDRYLAPALPAVVIAALAGLAALLATRPVARLGRRLRGAGPRRAAGAALLLGALALAVAAVPRTAQRYAELLAARRAGAEAAGHWLAAHTPESAVVAAHESGAIAFLARRRVVDTIGRVRPEIARAVGRPTYPRLLEQMFRDARVTHVAAPEEWLPVDNVPALWTAAAPASFSIHPWRPEHAHVVHGAAWAAAAAASRALRDGDYDRAIQTLERAIQIDRQSARLWMLFGVALGHVERHLEAEIAFRRAVELYPEWQEPRDALAAALAVQGKPLDAPPPRLPGAP